jgi:hypothetical protein
LESIPGLLKRLQIRAQATLDSGIVSLESIPGLLKRLQIRAQATLGSRIGSLESIHGFHNMKNEDEDDFFGSKRIYAHPLCKILSEHSVYFLYNISHSVVKHKYYCGNKCTFIILFILDPCFVHRVDDNPCTWRGV